MVSRLLSLLLAIAVSAAAAVPAPADHIGFEPGTDYKLANYEQIIGYFKKLDQGSDRLSLVEFGKSSGGRSTYVAFISSAENLRELDRYREINRKLALGLVGPAEADSLVKEGKAIVWIDSGLHASEVAPAQHAPVLAHLMVTDESDETRRIRDNVILMQVPVINPDGLDWIVEWYRKNVGTPYEIAPLPKLYQKYAGHDNNRDWFMLNLQETRNVARLLYREWFPHIVYNQHQQPAFPARIFVPPYAEPLNPNVPAQVMEGINLIGAAMKERFAREGQPGVLSYMGFDAWWNGGLRTSPAFHNMHGILTETAAGAYATPRVDEKDDLPKRFRNGVPTLEPSVFYQRPWEGGRWGVREAIEYMITADLAILDLAASRPRAYLRKAYELARQSIELGKKGGPYAYIVPADQWDASSALSMLRRLQGAGVAVHRAGKRFKVGDRRYPAGSYVLLAAQPFRPYLLDLMEPQKYPTMRNGENGSIKRPYDVTGWTLRMSMGVDVVRVDEPFQAELQPVESVPAPVELFEHRENSSFLATIKALKQGKRVRWGSNGEILVRGIAANRDFAAGEYELREPRLALYEPWTANMDTGWAQWVLDQYGVPYTLIHNDDVRRDDLRERFDSVLLASQSTGSILHGFRDAEATRRRNKPELDNRSRQRPEFTGGIGLLGAHNLQQFVRAGGTLITFDSASELPIDMFPLAVRDVAGSGDNDVRFRCPGALIHLKVDTASPIAFGMPAETIGFCRGGKAFDVTLLDGENAGEREIRSVVRYAPSDLLASGWIGGEKAVAGKPVLVEARHGKGRVILFGFRPHFRGQTFATFKLLLNSIYLASSRELN